MFKLNVVHSISSIQPAAGGPSRTVTQLTDSLANFSNVKVTLIYQSRVGASTIISTNPSVTRLVSESTQPLEMMLGLRLRRNLYKYLRDSPPAILHDHGLWMASNHWVACAVRAYGIPLVIQPRGMLEPWAIKNKAWKKRLAMSLYQWRNLQSASVLIATAESEYENLRAFGLRQPIAIIPNGVQLFENKGRAAQIKIGPKQKRTVLFLSRVQEKKGLINLIDAWAQLRPDHWCLQIAGPDEKGHLAEVMARVKQAGIEDAVNYVGEVDGDVKSQLYTSSDLFVLPTFSENFGVVVAEALAHGLPVITTQGAPWSDLLKYGCGWWVEIGVNPLINALREAMAISDDERMMMGARGREYVLRYDWTDIAQQSYDVYRWVLSLGPQPECVYKD